MGHDSRETPNVWLWDHFPRFRVGCLMHEEDLSAIRWTVDTQEDLDLVRRIWSRMRNGFTWGEIPPEFFREKTTGYYRPPVAPQDLPVDVWRVGP